MAKVAISRTVFVINSNIILPGKQRNASLILSQEVRLYGHSLFEIKLHYLQNTPVVNNLKLSANFLHIDP